MSRNLRHSELIKKLSRCQPPEVQKRFQPVKIECVAILQILITIGTPVRVVVDTGKPLLQAGDLGRISIVAEIAFT